MFYEWRLTDDEKTGGTTIFVNSFGEVKLAKSMSVKDFARYRKYFAKDWHRSWSEAFDNFQKVLDTRDPRP